MSTNETVNFGIVGACARGGSFKAACDAMDCISIAAVCDINEEDLPAAKERLGAERSYTSYSEMLEKENLDAVIIGTPMHLHVPMSIEALERDISVLCEVTAGVTLEECKDLVQACKTSKGIYMMAENYTYTKPNQIVKELVRQGLFGTPYYAEGEYLHELKHMNEHSTPWRRTWQTGVEGITYGTHSLGPILQWMPGDRVKRVCCEGTGVRHQDGTGKDYCQASSTMLCKTEKDALIKIRVDMVSDRPHAMNNYQLQGTDGCYESARGGPGDCHKLWCRELANKIQWTDLWAFENVKELSEKYLPEMWRGESGAAAAKAGHGGGDYFEVLDFLDALQGKRDPVIGIHEAMDMTLPGLISQQSILQDGAWLEVPDSRNW
ncbi:MAG: Gfo/Idh/MocA family protein [Planctomycetota bacterium]|jgi:predicted dehydrogenase